MHLTLPAGARLLRTGGNASEQSVVQHWPPVARGIHRLSGNRTSSGLWSGMFPGSAPSGLSLFSECCSAAWLCFFFFNGSTLAKMCFDKPSFHRAHLLTYMRVKINESIKGKECDPTRRFPVTSLNQLLHAEAPWPPGSHRLSLSRHRAGYGDRWGC